MPNTNVLSQKQFLTKFKVESSGFEIHLSIGDQKHLIVCLKPPKEIGNHSYQITDLTIERIYEELEQNQKNYFDNSQIIEPEVKEGWTIYHINLPLIITSDYMEENKTSPIRDRKTFIYPIKFFEENKKIKTNFEKFVVLDECRFQERVVFKQAVFRENLTLSQGGRFLNGINFENCIFDKKLLCEKVVFGSSHSEEKYYQFSQETIFKGSCFKKEVEFSNSRFCSDVYFNNCIFEEFSDFHECIFDKIACFYNANFKKTPNFSQALFKDNLNMVNAKMFFGFKDMQDAIRGVEKNFNEEKSDDEKKPLENFANDSRDTFRIFKNTFSEKSNVLDALNYHRVELYCKEIELDSKNSPIFSREWIDRWQLFFYRHTSDHHTDLLKIISWVIIAIGIFGFGFFIVKCYQDVSILSYLSPYGVALSLAGMVCLGIFWVMGYIKKLFLFAGVGLIPTLWIACYKPTLIFGVINLIDKTSRSGLENFILVLYTLVMILLLFSLQKTARKNSIVPS